MLARYKFLIIPTMDALDKLDESQGVWLEAVKEPWVEICLKLAIRDSKSTPCCFILKLPSKSLMHSYISMLVNTPIELRAHNIIEQNNQPDLLKINGRITIEASNSEIKKE